MNPRDSHLSSRRAFLGQSAAATGILAIGALALPALPAHALQFSTRDARLLTFLLNVQALQSDFFTNSALTITAEGLTAGEANTLSTIALQDERQMRWCKAALRKFTSKNDLPSVMSGGFKHKSPSFNALNSRESLLREALRLKSAAASAWIGAAGSADQGEMAGAFASLAGVQARHRAVLADALNQPSLMAMAPAMTLSDAARELEHFGFMAPM